MKYKAKQSRVGKAIYNHQGHRDIYLIALLSLAYGFNLVAQNHCCSFSHHSLFSAQLKERDDEGCMISL